MDAILPSLVMESWNCCSGARAQPALVEGCPADGRYLEGALSSRKSDVLRADISIEDLVSVDETSAVDETSTLGETSTVDETSIYTDIWIRS
jgi:hypothetical protein